MVVDGSAAVSRGQQSFFLAPNGVVLCDGNESGVSPPEFAIAVFAYEFRRNSTPILNRLDLVAARTGRWPIPYFSGPHDRVPTPGLKQDLLVWNRAQRSNPYGPESLRKKAFEDVTDAAPPPRLIHRPKDTPHLTPRFDLAASSNSAFYSTAPVSTRIAATPLTPAKAPPAARKSSRISETATAPEPPPRPKSAKAKSVSPMLLPRSVKDKPQNNLPDNQQEWPADHGGSPDGASVVRSRQSRHTVAESAASEKNHTIRATLATMKIPTTKKAPRTLRAHRCSFRLRNNGKN